MAESFFWYSPTRFAATAAAEIISQRRRDTERAVSKKTSLRCRDSVFHGRDDRPPVRLPRGS